MASFHQARSGCGADGRRRAGLNELACPEYTLEDRVDVLEVIAEIELLFDFGIRQVLLHLGVFF
jgi:hypothetical protein